MILMLGEPVWYFPKDRDPSNKPRIAFITEYGDSPKVVNLTVFNAPLGDCALDGQPVVDCVLNVLLDPTEALGPQEPYCLSYDKYTPPPPPSGEPGGRDLRAERIAAKYKKQGIAVPGSDESHDGGDDSPRFQGIPVERVEALGDSQHSDDDAE